MTVDLVRDLRIATTAARRALAVAEASVNTVAEKTDALALAAGERNDAQAAAFAGSEEVLLTVDDVAHVLRVSKPTLARWRVLGTGPRYMKRQGRILYRTDAIQEFITSKERKSTRDNEVD